MIPSYFFKTNIAFLDDSDNFRESVTDILSLEDKKIIEFSSPKSFLEFWEDYYKNKLYEKVCSLLKSKYNFDGMPNINKKKYDDFLEFREKKNLVSIVLLDYVMPGMNGIEIAKEIKEKNPETKVILLTGIGETQLATQAFNKGLIDQFIRKDDPNFLENIQVSITNLTHSFLYNLSRPYMDLIHENNLVNNKDYKIIVDKLMQKHNITEYSPTCFLGSLLMRNGKNEDLFFLNVFNDDFFKNLEELFELSDINHQKTNELKRKKAAPFSQNIFEEVDLIKGELFKCQSFDSLKGYFFTFIKRDAKSALNQIKIKI